MSQRGPLFATAGDREAGCTCPRCLTAIAREDPIAVCSACGSVHHDHCWGPEDGCAAYACTPGQGVATTGRDKLTITVQELEHVQPLPTRPVVVNPVLPNLNPAPPRTNRLAIAAFITALAGIPFFGLLTGLVAVVMGSWALGLLRTGTQRGLGFAISGVLLGLVDMVGWLVLIAVVLGRSGGHVQLNEFENDPAALQNLDPVLSRAMRATVLIEVERGLLSGRAIGSGVVLDLSPGEALLVTNRHVVDASYNGGEEQTDLDKLPTVQVHFIGQAAQPGHVVWLAPHGIDLALVRVAGPAEQARAALWQPHRPAGIGDPVFAIGNPHRLGWTHTQGSISQLRRQNTGGHDYRVLQTQTAINPGNSGGGLFDKEGYLLGINTWTNDKRFSEGLNFAIALDTLLDLHPPFLPVKPR